MPSLDPPRGVIPASPDELTPTWLATVFTRHGFSAAIEAITFEPFEEPALTSRITRVIPRVQDETTGVAPPLLWKRSLPAGASREAFQRGYAQEVRFYREVAPAVNVAAPRCFAAAHDPATGEHVLLLEDLTPAVPGNLAEGVSVDRAASVLRELARLHASNWSTDAPAQPPEAFARLRPFVEELAPAALPFLSEHVDARAGERTARYASEVAGLFAALSAGPQATVHGDAHPGNVLFPAHEDGRPFLIDWQGCSVDAPLRDVARFLTLGLTIEDRRRHEDELLAGYLADLEGNGVHVDRRAIARLYRTALTLQWGWAVIFFRLEASWDAGTRAAMPALVRRAAAAFDDAIEAL